MSEEAPLTPAQEEAQAQIDAIRDPGHPQHAVASADRERWYKARYPEPVEEPIAPEGPVKRADFAREGVTGGAGIPGLRAALDRVNAELAKGLHTERVRQGLMAER